MVYLIVTIVADVIGVLLLGKARGFERPLYLLAGIICMVIGFVAFSFAAKSMSTGIANVIWAGMSTVLVLLAGRLFLGDTVNTVQLACVALIIIGTVGLQFFEKA